MPRVPDAHRLFFALMPPATLLDELSSLRDSETRGKAQANHRLHVTMFLFEQSVEFQASIATRIRKALDAQVLPSCRVVFDQLVCDKDRALLLASGKFHGLSRLQTQLATLLSAVNLHPAAYWQFRPHMTLRVRGAKGTPGESFSINPVGWKAKELVLLDSLIGLTHYDLVGRWPLRDIKTE